MRFRLLIWASALAFIGAWATLALDAEAQVRASAVKLNGPDSMAAVTVRVDVTVREPTTVSIGGWAVQGLDQAGGFGWGHDELKVRLKRPGHHRFGRTLFVQALTEQLAPRPYGAGIMWRRVAVPFGAVAVQVSAGSRSLGGALVETRANR